MSCTIEYADPLNDQSSAWADFITRGWWLTVGEDVYGPFDSRAEAEKYAIDNSVRA